MKPWIQTISGGAVDLDNPKPEQIRIRDIAWSLSNINRWTGHTTRPFSVAEHSVVVAQLVVAMAPKGDEFRSHVRAALMHDAHEAYTGDISSPLKTLLPQLKQIQLNIQDAIDQRFGLLKTSELVHLADGMSLALERAQILGECSREWGWEPPEPVREIRLQCLSPEHSFSLFNLWCWNLGITDEETYL